MTHVERLFGRFLDMVDNTTLNRFETDSGCLWVAPEVGLAFEVFDECHEWDTHAVIMRESVVIDDAINE